MEVGIRVVYTQEAMDAYPARKINGFPMAGMMGTVERITFEQTAVEVSTVKWDHLRIPTAVQSSLLKPLVATETLAPDTSSVSLSNKELSDEVSRRLTGTGISDEQLINELRSRIEHLDGEECYNAVTSIGAGGRDCMVADELCDAVEMMLKLAREEA